MGRYDPSKLQKLGISYPVTSSPKIASKMQGWPKKWYDRVQVALLLPLVRQKGDEWIPWKASTVSNHSNSFFLNFSTPK